MDGDATDARLVLAARIEDLRAARGLTIDGLAERSGLDRTQVEEVLHGASDFGISVILRLASALDVKVEDLVDGIRWIPGPAGGEYRTDGPHSE